MPELKVSCGSPEWIYWIERGLAFQDATARSWGDVVGVIGRDSCTKYVGMRLVNQAVVLARCLVCSGKWLTCQIERSNLCFLMPPEDSKSWKTDAAGRNMSPNLAGGPWALLSLVTCLAQSEILG